MGRALEAKREREAKEPKQDAATPDAENTVYSPKLPSRFTLCTTVKSWGDKKLKPCRYFDALDLCVYGVEAHTTYPTVTDPAVTDPEAPQINVRKVGPETWITYKGVCW